MNIGMHVCRGCHADCRLSQTAPALSCSIRLLPRGIWILARANDAGRCIPTCACLHTDSLQSQACMHLAHGLLLTLTAVDAAPPLRPCARVGPVPWGATQGAYAPNDRLRRHAHRLLDGRIHASGGHMGGTHHVFWALCACVAHAGRGLHLGTRDYLCRCRVCGILSK